MASSVTEEAFAKWMTPGKAVEILSSAFGTNSNNYIAKQTLLEALRAGLVVAVAKTSTAISAPAPIELEEIPRSHWGNVDTNNRIWTTSHVTYQYANSKSFSGLSEVSRFGVRFEPTAVLGLLPPSIPKPQSRLALVAADEPKVPKVTPPTNKGGRPPKEWWDDFWIEICRQIYSGELVPKKQVDLEKAMHDWVVKEGHDASERTIRNVARRLFAALNSEGKN